MKPRISFMLLFAFFISIANLGAQEKTKFTEKLSSTILSAQEETLSVWIFFTDKGGQIDSKLSLAEKNLPENSVKRRKKTFKKEGNLATFYDIPVKQEYINQIAPLISKYRQTSKWLNAISAEININKLKNISEFPFVRKIDVVRKGKYFNPNKQVNTSPIENLNLDNSKFTLNYGASLTQNQQINVPAAHDMGYSGEGVIICVMDAGFNNLEHQSFSSMNIVDAWDFVNNDNNVDDEGDMGIGDHGTMTLSTIGGFYEGELIGPAYGADYILAKTENTDSETQVEEDNWVAAMEWAEANYGPDITSTSLGYINFDDGSWYSPEELDGNTAIITIGADIAASLGILVVNSAGNEGPGTTTIGAPADGDSVLAVGAVYNDGTITGFSSMGPTGDGRIKPEVMAMGSGVVVAETYGNYYSTASGTSFSCPLTAGAAALLIEMVPNASNMEIFEALKATANNASNPNNQYGWGILDVIEAYNYLNSNPAPTIAHSALPNVEDLIGPYVVSATIESNYPFVGDSPKLYYRVDQGSWLEVSMDAISKGMFEAEIIGTGEAATYDYYIEAENTETTTTLPQDAPTNFYSFETSPNSIINVNPIDLIDINPNPASDIINVTIVEDIKCSVYLYNSIGQEIVKNQFSGKSFSIDVSNLKNGIYYLKIQIEDNISVSKISIRH